MPILEAVVSLAAVTVETRVFLGVGLLVLGLAVWPLLSAAEKRPRSEDRSS